MKNVKYFLAAAFQAPG